jgi:hypothetical protein
MSLDPAVDLVTAYLRINGYFVLTEFEIHRRVGSEIRTLTDVDVIAVRHPTSPGPVHYRGGDGAEECAIMTTVDPDLDLGGDRVDVLIGEVKQGEALFNPAIQRPEVLHAAVRRVGDVFGEPLDGVVDQLVETGHADTETARVRLVVFAGHGRVEDRMTMHLDQVVTALVGHLRSHEALSRATRFSDPGLAVIALLEKTGADIAGSSGTVPVPREEEAAP